VAKAGPRKVEERAARCIRCSVIAVAPIGSPQASAPGWLWTDVLLPWGLTAWLGFADRLRAP
jgi:hypothetical protein